MVRYVLSDAGEKAAAPEEGSFLRLLSHIFMVEDLLVHQGREQAHARDRGSNQEVPHGLPPAEVLQGADDQKAWDTRAA